MTDDLNRVVLTPLRQIDVAGGPVYHGMKASDPGFAGFGEAYFSFIDSGAVKGWKRHNRMTLNFVVPIGDVGVTVYHEVTSQSRSYRLCSHKPESYGRLTIPPGFWVAFGGLGNARSVMLNIASLAHNPHEADTVPITHFCWSWGAFDL